MSDKPKSVLDIITWCENLENRLHSLEKKQIQAIETGYVSLVEDPILSVEGKGDKSVTQKVLFEKPFTEIPQFFPSITAFNLGDNRGARLEVLVKEVTKVSAEFTVRAWRESLAYYVRIDWFAVGTR